MPDTLSTDDPKQISSYCMGDWLAPIDLDDPEARGLKELLIGNLNIQIDGSKEKDKSEFDKIWQEKRALINKTISQLLRALAHFLHTPYANELTNKEEIPSAMQAFKLAGESLSSQDDLRAQI